MRPVFLLPALLFGSLPTVAQEPNIPAALVWMDGGQFIVERGSSDGLVGGQYVQVLQDRRYKSRAICLKVDSTHSLWAIYNAYEPLVLDKNVLLKPSSSHPLNDELRATMNLDIPPMAEFVARTQSKDRIDDNEKPSENADIVLAERLKEKFAEREAADNLAYDYVRDNDPDLNDLSLTVGIAPFIFKNISGSHEGSYNISLTRNVPEKHRVDGKLSYERSSFVNSAESSVISESRYDGRLIYEYGFFTDTLRPFSFMSYERLREDTFFPIRMAVNFGPIGLKYYFKNPPDHFEEMALAYIPAVDYLSRDELIFDNALSRWGILRTSDVNFRHNFIFQGRASFFEKKMDVSNITLLRPIQELEGFGIDFSDLNLRMETEAKYRFHRYFSASYVNLLLNDQRSQTLDGLPSTEIAHMFTINYEKRF